MAKAEPGKGKEYFYFVDGVRYESDVSSITGREIKVRANIDPTYTLLLEGHGGKPDQIITDDTSVDLSQPGIEKFFAIPPATFGR